MDMISNKGYKFLQDEPIKRIFQVHPVSYRRVYAFVYKYLPRLRLKRIPTDLVQSFRY